MVCLGCSYVLEGRCVWFALVVATCLKDVVFGLSWFWLRCLKDVVFWFDLVEATVFEGCYRLWVVQTCTVCCTLASCCPRYKALVQFGVANVTYYLEWYHHVLVWPNVLSAIHIIKRILKVQFLLFPREDSTLKTNQQVLGDQRTKNMRCAQEQQVS